MMQMAKAREFLRDEAPECDFYPVDPGGYLMGYFALAESVANGCFIMAAVTGRPGALDEETWFWLGTGPGCPEALMVCSVLYPPTKETLRAAIRKLR